MLKKQKLELTWIGKGESPNLEPRILIEDPSLSYGDCVIFLGVGFDDENGSILQHRISISVLSGGKMISLIDSRFSNEIIFRTVDDFIDYFKLQYKRLLEVSILEPVDSRVAKEIPTLSLFKIQQKRSSE